MSFRLTSAELGDFTLRVEQDATGGVALLIAAEGGPVFRPVLTAEDALALAQHLIVAAQVVDDAPLSADQLDDLVARASHVA